MKKLGKIFVCVLCLVVGSVSLIGCAGAGIKGDELTVQAKDFYKFVMSVEGQAIVAKKGLVPIETAANYTTAKDSIAKDTVELVGSTSMTAIMEALVEGYNLKQSKVIININGGGSGKGKVEAANKYTNTFGLVSAELSDEDKKTLQELKIATDGVAVIANNTNAVENLTKSEVASIFKGEKKKWNELNAALSNADITLVQREEGSGTRGAFEELLSIKGLVPLTATTKDSTGAVITVVSEDTSSIGYASLANIGSTVKTININGVACTNANIANGTYVIARPFVLVVSKDMKIA